jgi:tyrosine-specific transport protein
MMATSFVAIPFAVSASGFWPSVIAMAFSWAYLWASGFYYLEATLANPKGSNVFSISLRYTGVGGAWCSAIIFVLVNFGYFVYFMYLTAPILSQVLSQIGIPLSHTAAIVLMLAVFGGCVALGMQFTIIVNFLLTLLIGVILFFCFTAGFEPGIFLPLTGFHWGFFVITLPTLINTLYINTFIPTLAQFLKYNKKHLQSSIIVALTLGFLIFIAWLWLAITSAGSSLKGLSQLNPEAINYANLVQVPYFGKWLPHLLFLTTFTTALAVGLILVDFCCDILKIPVEQRRGVKRLAISLVVFAIALLLSIIPSQLLYTLFLYISDIGSLYLVGLLPVMWIWSLRYFYQDQVPQMVFGGKVVLFIFTTLACFVLYIAILEIFYQRTFR